MTKQVFILLGGLFGIDGYADSRGMISLGDQIKQLPNTQVSVFSWDHWEKAFAPIKEAFARGDKIIIIGYSGGGSRATYLVNALGASTIDVDLLVVWDPSPAWQMEPINKNVQEAVCYHNTNPMMWVPFIGELGGGQLTGDIKITTHNIAEQHLLVQDNQTLHNETIALVRNL